MYLSFLLNASIPTKTPNIYSQSFGHTLYHVTMPVYNLDLICLLHQFHICMFLFGAKSLAFSKSSLLFVPH